MKSPSSQFSEFKTSKDDEDFDEEVDVNTFEQMRDKFFKSMVQRK